MGSITLTTTVGEDRHLEIDLPPDVPVGRVELIIRPLTPDAATQPQLSRDEIRRRLKEAELLSEGTYAPADAVPLSDTEREELGRLFASAQPISELIDEDRGPR